MVQSFFVRPLTEEEIKELKQRASSQAQEEAWRARAILLSAEGKGVTAISETLGYHPSNVKKWVRKFNKAGLDGIASGKRGPRGGPKPRFSKQQVARIVELAEADPFSLGLGFRRWTAQKLASAAVERGLVERISHVTVRQILMRQEPQSGLSTGKNPIASTDDLDDARRGMQALADCDFELAAECLYRALEPALQIPDDEALIRASLSTALAELSRCEEAFSVIEKYETVGAVSSLSAEMRARVKLQLGWANAGLRNYPRAIASFNEARKSYSDLRDDLGISKSHFGLGSTYGEINEFAIARDHLIAAVSFQSVEDDRDLLAKILDRLGSVDFYEGKFASAKQNYLKALEIAQGSKNANILGRILLNLGTPYNWAHVGELKEQEEYFKRAIESLKLGGKKSDLATAYNNVADVLWYSGSWDEASEYLRKSIQVAQEICDPRLEGTARGTLAEILAARGRLAEAETHLKKVLTLVQGRGDKWVEGNAIRILAGIRRIQGRLDDSLSLLRQSLQVSTSIGDLHNVTLIQISVADAYFLQGQLEEAAQYLESAQARLKEEESLFVSGLVQRLAGLIERERGRFAQAKQHIAQSISIFTTTGIKYETARSHYQMGFLLHKVGDTEAARRHLRNAQTIFEALDAKPDLEVALSTIVQLDGGYPLVNGLSSSPTGKLSNEPNDLLLMERLIEASTSRELIFEELGAIIFENFSADAVFISSYGSNGEVQLQACWGIEAEDAARLANSLQQERSRTLSESFPLFAARLHDGTTQPMLCIRSKVPIDIGRLQPLIKQTELGLETCRLRAATRLSVTPNPTHSVHTVMPGFLIANPLMFEVIERIEKIRTSDVTVLITGESGTGKELVARAIHAESARASAIFLPFNCTATPKDILDSQLFGHRRGSFTGALANYPGVIRAAEGGTLFLDEIGDLSLESQPKLMRFLQEGEIQPIGETRPMKVDVRVIAATNTDLERAVEEGRFREDLFHRLNIIRIHVPPLRERRDEVPVLAAHFLDHFTQRSRKKSVSLSQDAIDALSAYNWPGNIRQLRNEIERLVAYAADEARVLASDLSPEVANQSNRMVPVRNGSGRHSADREFSVIDRSGRRDDERMTAPAWLQSSEAPKRRSSQERSNPVKLKDAVAELERRVIAEALERNRYNLTRTAGEVGLSRRGLRLKLAQLGLEKDLS